MSDPYHAEYWAGKCIDDMTADELRVALRRIAAMMKREYEHREHEREVLAAARAARGPTIIVGRS